tara:strand:+ start:357 stop:581 length:225 start_codon:yes stop_codon:yes gene_type:complete
MKKIIKLVFSFCLLGVVLTQVYVEGETVSLTDQNQEFNVCHGEYPSNVLKLSDFNGDLNGGNYTVIHFDMSASW